MGPSSPRRRKALGTRLCCDVFLVSLVVSSARACPRFLAMHYKMSLELIRADICLNIGTDEEMNWLFIVRLKSF